MQPVIPRTQPVMDSEAAILHRYRPILPKADPNHAAHQPISAYLIQVAGNKFCLAASFIVPAKHRATQIPRTRNSFSESDFACANTLINLSKRRRILPDDVVESCHVMIHAYQSEDQVENLQLAAQQLVDTLKNFATSNRCTLCEAPISSIYVDSRLPYDVVDACHKTIHTLKTRDRTKIDLQFRAFGLRLNEYARNKGCPLCPPPSNRARHNSAP